MTELATAILAEQQLRYAPRNAKIEKKMVSVRQIGQTKELIERSMAKDGRVCLSFSGGSDSLVLLDLFYRTKHKPIIIWVDTQMEYPGSQEFIEKTVAKYGFDLRIAQAKRSPTEQWAATGWPMLGKMSARLWMQKTRGAMGFAINVSECCRAIKITPARTLARNLGCGVQFTGQRGISDDNLRGFRNIKEGSLFYQAKDRIWISNPLTGWEDSEIKSYIEERELPQHPARANGAATIGCVYCGGGSQYTNSGYRILRKSWPEAWNRFMVEWGGGFVILALKYERHILDIQEAVTELGGLETLAKNQPWIFDFTRKTPRPGYNK